MFQLQRESDRESLSYSFFVLFRSIAHWIRLTHKREDNLLYSVYQFKCPSHPETLSLIYAEQYLSKYLGTLAQSSWHTKSPITTSGKCCSLDSELRLCFSITFLEKMNNYVKITKIFPKHILKWNKYIVSRMILYHCKPYKQHNNKNENTSGPKTFKT